jgi:hypothetical protein
MKRIALLLFTIILSGTTLAQYGQLDLHKIAELDVTLAIREVMQHLTEETSPDSFGFVSNSTVTKEVHDLIIEILQPFYAPDGDTLALREWLETYYTQDEMASEMELYFTDEGLNSRDFADALTMYLTMSYLVSNHLDSTPPEHDLAVRDQVRAALAKSKHFANLNDAEKQGGAMLLLFFVSYGVGEYNRARETDTCAAEDKTPGASKTTLADCPKFTIVDNVSTFTTGLAKIFGFQMTQVVLTEHGFEPKD